MKFKFYSENIVQRARALREKGSSAKKISKILKVGDTTILRWCNDIPSKNPYHIHIQKLKEKASKRSIGLIEDIKITKEFAKFLVSIIYWCEGSKYPSSNFIAFSNSDIGLVKTFLKLFRTGFKPKENKLKVSLQLHTNHDKKKMISFWSKSLNIPENQFYKATITKPTKNMKRKDYKGTCTVRYHDVYLLHEIIGIYEEFFKKLNYK